VKPLEKRTYKYKSPTNAFFCPLCRTERAITTSPRLTKKNYVQVLLTSIVLGLMLFPFMGVKCFFIFFVVLTVFELSIRTDFKKQVPCPHCGFDATWYKKDVRVARQVVKEFWDQKQSADTAKSAISLK
jgi:hypothetical protein